MECCPTDKTKPNVEVNISKVLKFIILVQTPKEKVTMAAINQEQIILL